MASCKIAVIVGSNRRDSINRKLAQALIRLGRDGAGFELARIDDLPMYNQDLENTPLASVVRFKAKLLRPTGCCS